MKLALALCLVAPLFAQSVSNLRDVKSIYIEPLGVMPGASSLHDEVMAQIQKSPIFRLASKAEEADAVLAGNGEVWVKGHYSLNPRSRTINADSKAVYAGFLSIELQSRTKETLWSYLATPHDSNSSNVTRDLAKLVVKKLTDAVNAER